MSFLRKRDARTEHEYIQESLSAYLDGELSSRDRAAVDRHLSACRQCRWNLETLRQTIRWTGSLPAVPVPRAFTVPVQPKPMPAPRWRWSMPLLQGATALIAVLFFLAVAGNAYLTRMVPVPQGAETTAVEWTEGEAVAAEAAVEKEAVLESSPTEQVEQVAELPPDYAPEVSSTGENAIEPQKVMSAPAPAMEAGAAEPRISVAAEESAADVDAATESARGEGVAEVEETLAAPTVPPSPSVAPSIEPRPTAVQTMVAKAYEEVQPAAPEPRQVGTALVEEPILPWLETAEIALGAAFVLLGTITIFVTVRWLRAH